MRRLLIAGAALGALIAAGPATAADLSPVYKAAPVVAPVYDWTGFYIGVNAGYAWGRSNVASTFACPGASGACAYSFPGNLGAIGAAGSGTLSPNGFVGGAQAGYNWQTGSAVFSIEADFDAFDLAGSQTAGGPVPFAPPGLAFAVNTGVRAEWLSTVRARVGWTVAPTVLVYATGGLALTELRVANSFIDNFAATGLVATNTAGASSATQTKAGWAAGGGVEWALGQKWTVKGEYLYVDFGSVSTTATVVNPALAALAVPNLLTTSANLTAHIARVGANFRF
jgi:outer membrane immunogenic protein